MNLGRANKAIASFVTSLTVWGGVVVASKATHVTASEWLGLSAVFLTPLSVYAVANDPAPAPQPVLEEPIPVQPVGVVQPAEDPAAAARRDG